MIRREELFTPIKDLGLSIRAEKALTSIGVSNLYELAQLSRVDILGIANCGIRSISEIDKLLSSHRLHWGMKESELRAEVDFDPSADGRSVILTLTDLEALLYKWQREWQQEYDKQREEMYKLKAALIKGELKTATEICNALEVSKDTLYKWKRNGWLDVYRENTGVSKFCVDDVKALIYIRDHHILKQLALSEELVKKLEILNK